MDRLDSLWKTCDPAGIKCGFRKLFYSVTIILSLKKQQLAVHYMHPSQLSVKDFTYELPEERIARFPLEQRDASNLLIYMSGIIAEDGYSNLSNYLPANSVLVFNNTRVIPARLLFRKPEGGIIEIFLLDPVTENPGIAGALEKKESASWKCLIGGASKWKHGYRPEISVRDKEEIISLKAEITERLADAFIVRFTWSPPEKTFSEILDITGITPLPPYLKRAPESDDKLRYQTLFAKWEGSVAAPTAGLHFTETIFESLKAKNIESLFLTLHVGAGTFKPVKSETMAGHTMHAEWMEVDLPTIIQLAENEARVFAVGTTSLRTLESLYWMGVKCLEDPFILSEALDIKQWEVYDDLPNQYSKKQALEALIAWLKENQITNMIIKTGILIAPGYKFRMIEGLITNFHQPQSTLLLLVAALAGNDWKRVYQYAIDNGFRFLSYGDGCLIFKTEQK